MKGYVFLLMQVLRNAIHKLRNRLCHTFIRVSPARLLQSITAGIKWNVFVTTKTPTMTRNIRITQRAEREEEPCHAKHFLTINKIFVK